MKKLRLLIIEDEISVAKQLKWGLDKKYDITITSEADEAKLLLVSGNFPVATLDLGLPPYPDTTQEGFRLLAEIASVSPQTKVIVITGNAEEENAIQAIALGAADFCSKPIDLKLLDIILSRTFKIHGLEEANQRLQNEIVQDSSFCGMLGISPNMDQLFKRIKQVSDTDYPVLITGASGTGKEMAANAIHKLSSRSLNPMVIINCGAIPDNLLESELFGHEKGAFTGAVGRKTGRLEQADNGTVFLDEIGELPLTLQVKILRFLQEGTIERIGGTKTITLDVRIIAATNINLEKAVEKGAFREDLFYRINVIPLRIPDLKERNEDILLLAQHFLREESQALGRGQTSFSPAAISALVAYNWPGNVRQLHNLIRRALATNPGRIIDPVDLDLKKAEKEPKEEKLPTLKQARKTAEIKTIRQAMALTGNNISQAAKLLKTSRPTLHDLLKKYKISS